MRYVQSRRAGAGGAGAGGCELCRCDNGGDGYWVLSGGRVLMRGEVPRGHRCRVSLRVLDILYDVEDI